MEDDVLIENNHIQNLPDNTVPDSVEEVTEESPPVEEEELTQETTSDVENPEEESLEEEPLGEEDVEDVEDVEDEEEPPTVEEQLVEIKKMIGGLSGTIDYLKSKYHKHREDECNHHKFHHKGNGYHRHPAEVEISYTEGKYTNSKLIKSIYKTYDKRLKITPPSDKNSKRNSIYFIDFPIGLTETCHSKYHVEGTCCDKYHRDYLLSKDKFFRLINKIKHTHLRPEDFDLSLPRVIHDGKYNTEITLSPKKLSGYTGDIVLRYRRQKIDVVFRRYTPSNDTESLYLSEYLEKLKLPLLSVDYKECLLPAYDPDFPKNPRSVKVVAKETSLFYYGEVEISIYNRKIYYNLDGSLNEELSEGFELTESEKSKAKDIVVIDSSGDIAEVVIYRDGSIYEKDRYSLDEGLNPFSNVLIDEDTKIKPLNGFEINNDRYCLYGTFKFKFKDVKNHVLEADCNSIIVDRNFSVLVAEDNLFNIDSYNPDKVLITTSGKVVTVSKDLDLDLTCLYYFCTDGHILSTVSIEKDTSIIPDKIFAGNDDTVYVTSTIADNKYKIYKTNQDGSLATYKDSDGNVYPYRTMEVSSSDANVEPGELMDIKDTEGYTYVSFLSKTNYSIDENTTLIDDEVSSSPIKQPRLSCWNPIKKCSEDGGLIEGFNDVLKNIDNEFMSLNVKLPVKNIVDVRRVEEGLISMYVKKKNIVRGIPTYGFLVMDKDGNLLNHKFIDFNESIIDEIYNIKFLDNGTYCVVANVVYSGLDNEELNKKSIIIYTKNFSTKSIMPLKGKETFII